MLVSPSEPEQLRQLGRVSNRCEERGADFLMPSVHWGLVGIQRKEVGDLIGSFYSGRLQKQLMRMRAGCGLVVLLVEGNMAWTADGNLVGQHSWSLAQHHGLLCSMQSEGCWIMASQSVGGSAWLLSWFARWLMKETHTSLHNRPGPDSLVQGHKTAREMGVYLLQGIEGIGPKMAGDIYDHFGGVPLKWGVGVEELVKVRGVGPKKAEKMWKALKG